MSKEDLDLEIKTTQHLLSRVERSWLCFTPARLRRRRAQFHPHLNFPSSLLTQYNFNLQSLHSRTSISYSFFPTALLLDSSLFLLFCQILFGTPWPLSFLQGRSGVWNCIWDLSYLSFRIARFWSRADSTSSISLLVSAQLHLYSYSYTC